MAMMHVKVPRKSGFLFWDELGCLARALGYRVDLFSANIPEDFTPAQEDGLTVKELEQLITEHKCFNSWLDRTSNIHTDEWNLHVILKASKLLNSHVIQFPELHAIRVAYQLYEELDTKGMPLNETLLQRAIKMCGRMISPLKMLHRLKHMKPSFEEEDRMQLHELLDLILWCDVYEGMSALPPPNDISKDKEDMYKLLDFNKLLSHYDKLLAERLDKKYLKEEQTFTEIKHGSRELPKDVPPVNSAFRINQVKRHNHLYHRLNAELSRSQQQVQTSKAGYVRERPISAPERSSYDPAYQSRERMITEDAVKQKTVMDIAGKWIKHCYDMDNVRNPAEPCPPYPRPPTLNLYQRPHTAPVVTEAARSQTEYFIRALDFEIKTLDHKYQQILNEDLDFLLPGYREWREKNPKIPPPPPPEPRPPHEPKPSEETLCRLCYHQTPAPPPPAHARACDARYRGWHKVRTKPGQHYVLSKTTSKNMLPPRVLAQHGMISPVPTGQNQYIHRLTRKQDVNPDRPRPATVPRDMQRQKSTHRHPSYPKPTSHPRQSPSLALPAESKKRSPSPSPCASPFPVHVSSRSKPRRGAFSEDSEDEGGSDRGERWDSPESAGRRSGGSRRTSSEHSDDDIEQEQDYTLIEEEKSTQGKRSQKKKQKSDSSSETLDFNFLTAKVQHRKKLPAGPKFISPQTPPTPPSILAVSEQQPMFKQQDKDRQVSFEQMKSPEVTESEASESESEPVSDESESDSDQSEDLRLKLRDQKLKLNLGSKQKISKLTVLEDIKESEEPASSILTPVMTASEEENVKDHEATYQEMESSASKMWPKQHESDDPLDKHSQTPSPSPHLLAHLEEYSPRKSGELTPSEISTSLSIRTNPHTEVVRSLSARKQQSASGVDVQRRRVNTPDYPAAGEPGVVLLKIPDSWTEHPWILDMLQEDSGGGKGSSEHGIKTYRRLVKRGKGQISPRLKRRFELGQAAY